MQSIDRAVSILHLLSEQGGMTISDIGEFTDLPLSTVHRILHSLQSNHLVVQDPRTKCYKLGLRLLNMASSLLNSNRVIEAARPYMARLAGEHGKLVFLCQEQGGNVVCVDSVVGSARPKVQFFVQIGSLMPLHASAPAKVIFSFSPREKYDLALKKSFPLQRFTPQTKCDPAQIAEELEMCRCQGYAICDEEMETGVFAAAAPVFGYNNEILASVALVTLKQEDRLPDLVAGIKQCGAEISRDMGCAYSRAQLQSC